MPKGERMSPDDPPSELERGNEPPHREQQALIQHERLRALRQMATAIAHDINNSIAPLSLYTDILLDQESDLSPSGREHLQTIRSTIDNVARTLARMQDFYRAHVPPHQSKDL